MFFFLFLLSCIKQREDEAVMKPEAKSENPAPVKKTETEISTSEGKTVSLLLCFSQNHLFIIIL